MTEVVDNPPMACWETLRAHGPAIALIDGLSGDVLTYRELADRVEHYAQSIPLSRRAVVLVFGEQDPGCVAWVLGCLRAGHAVYLLPTRVDHPSARCLIQSYQPELILWRSGKPDLPQQYRGGAVPGDYQCAIREPGEARPPHPALALILSTSASVGAAKSVRLSRTGLATNAAQITRALHITAGDRAIINLPLGHVYGFSVVSSHLLVGASVVIEPRSAANPAFWSSACEAQATSLPGVSLTYDYLRARGITAEHLPHLRKLMHTGDRMSDANATWLGREFGHAGANIYLMYGQTEASGRISVLPPELFSSRPPRSVGLSVAGGSLHADGDGQIIYRGPNVMLGYAHHRTDLAAGDVMSGTLPTGDLGCFDGDGLLYITGRIARRCKLFGHRIDLDDMEAYFSHAGPAAVLPGREGGVTIFFSGRPELMRARLLEFCQAHRLPPQDILLRRIESLPRTASGKVAYSALQSD